MLNDYSLQNSSRNSSNNKNDNISDYQDLNNEN